MWFNMHGEGDAFLQQYNLSSLIKHPNQLVKKTLTTHGMMCTTSMAMGHMKKYNRNWA
jgi:hypothetical protein